MRVAKHGTVTEYSKYGCRCDPCKAATSANRRAYRKKNPEKLREYERNRSNKAQRNEIRRLRETPETRRRRALKHYYGITLEEYDIMLIAQSGRCSICKGYERDKYLVVDHCHTTNRIRGLLCNPCNQGIGLLRESPEILTSAMEYLDAANQST